MPDRSTNPGSPAMAGNQVPGSRSLSPWWGLLILPVAGFIGWGLGQLPSPEPKRPAAPPPAVAKPAEAGAGPRRTIEVVASSDAPLNPALEQAPATPEPEPEIS